LTYLFTNRLVRQIIAVFLGAPSSEITTANGQGRIMTPDLIEGNDAFSQIRHIWRMRPAAESSALT
jgi:hypothetical protein